MDFGDAVTMVRAAVDRGINLFDVGVYGSPGQPPVFTDVLFSAIVRAIGLPRNEYVLSTKLWLEDFPEVSLRPQLEKALFRVGLDEADIAIVGDLHGKETDLAQVAQELADLESAGLIGCWGVNNWSASAIEEIRNHARAVGSPGPQMAQLKYSPCRRTIAEGPPFQGLFAEGITLQASDVLEGGILAGKRASTRAIGRDVGDIRRRMTDAADGIAAVATDWGVSAAQVCIAFALTHPAVSTVLFGASSQGQLMNNIEALELLNRVGPDSVRSAVARFWLDRDWVDPTGVG